MIVHILILLFFSAHSNGIEAGTEARTKTGTGNQTQNHLGFIQCVQKHQFGCYKGYCWANCYGPLTEMGVHNWCYTTKSYSQSYEYVKCTSDDQCNACWNCGGPCAAF